MTHGIPIHRSYVTDSRPETGSGSGRSQLVHGLASGRANGLSCVTARLLWKTVRDSQLGLFGMAAEAVAPPPETCAHQRCDGPECSATPNGRIDALVPANPSAGRRRHAAIGMAAVHRAGHASRTDRG